ncbi:agmatinase, partial [candidate division KSB1 bacterium]|nr:agmatinase [candidate division KSB1 bacterium]
MKTTLSFKMIEHRFLGNDLPDISYEAAKVIIIPAPLEETVSYGGGTAKGPQEILKASGYVELYDEEIGKEPCEMGIHTSRGISSELSQSEFLTELENLTYQVCRTGKYPVIIGGEHSLTIAPVKAFRQIHGN